jgi:hypothetical protein
MKKIIFSALALGFSLYSFCQDLTPKERAESLAKNEFSKTKHKKEENDGVVKEKTRVIESFPVVKTDLSFYEGNYVYKDLNYKIEIRSDKQNKMIATLKIGEGPEMQLKDVAIQDAFFQATKDKENGMVEIWEGAFINRTDEGQTEFGLGIKLPKAIQLTEGLQITRIFLKKVSP